LEGQEERYALRISYYAGDMDFKVQGTIPCSERDKANFEKGIEIARRYLQENEDFWIPLSEDNDDRFYTEKLDKAFSFEKISEKEYQKLEKKCSDDTMHYRTFEFFEDLGLSEEEGLDTGNIYFGVFEGYVNECTEDDEDPEDNDD
jgi:hypothetical protein